MPIKFEELDDEEKCVFYGEIVNRYVSDLEGPLVIAKDEYGQLIQCKESEVEICGQGCHCWQAPI